MEYKAFIEHIKSITTIDDVPTSEMERTALRASELMIVGIFDKRDRELTQLGQCLTRMAAFHQTRQGISGWVFMLDLLGQMAGSLAAQIVVKNAVTRLFQFEKGRLIASKLLGRPRIQAKDLRFEIDEKDQPNLNKKLEPLLRARLITIEPGKQNSRFYRLTPQGRSELSAALRRERPGNAVKEIQREPVAVKLGPRGGTFQRTKLKAGQPTVQHATKEFAGQRS